MNSCQSHCQQRHFRSLLKLCNAYTIIKCSFYRQSAYMFAVEWWNFFYARLSTCSAITPAESIIVAHVHSHACIHRHIWLFVLQQQCRRHLNNQNCAFYLLLIRIFCHRNQIRELKTIPWLKSWLCGLREKPFHLFVRWI